MPKIQNDALTATQIKTAKPKEKDYKLTDGRGLFLLVTKTGGKLWRLKYRFNSKEKLLALGNYPELSLAEARKLREIHRSEIAKGVDPSEQKKAAKVQAIDDELKAKNTFEFVAFKYVKHVAHNQSEGYIKRVYGRLKRFVFPFIGNVPISDIKPSDLIDIAKRIEDGGTIETAHRVLMHVGSVYKYAVSNGFTERNITADIDKKNVLKSHTKKHMPTITDPVKIKGLLNAIDEYTGDYSVKKALQFAPYVAVRPQNIRFARWVDIDFKDKLWRIPAEQMKMKEPHIVPLTDRTISILEEIQQLTGDTEYVFASSTHKGRPLSENTLNAGLRRMGFTKDEIVSHGFRSMFSTIAHEKSKFHFDVIETQLAHKVGNQVSQAYNRAKYLDERRELMQWWSDWLDEVKGRVKKRNH